MSCFHCKDTDIDDGLVCGFCLGDVNCGLHEDQDECMGLVTPEQKAKYAEMIGPDGNVFHHVCEDCGAVVAGCDYTDGDDEPCGQEAYKFTDRPEPEGKATTHYWCEEHGHIPGMLEAMGFIGEWGAYQPGKEGCSCDFPY